MQRRVILQKNNPIKQKMDKHQIYHSEPEIMGGTPVFTGTRIPVDSLIIHLKAGDSLDQFLDGFPSVSREQAKAFLELVLAKALESTPQKPLP